VADRLKVEEDVVDALPEVTSVFADIVGFTEATTGLRPEEVVAALNQIFTSFDEIASRHGLEKIKTIGDGYLAVSGAPIPRVDHLECVADAALEMVAVTQGMTYGGVPLQVRMGIDTGPVVAGVIGTSKFSYDLWGDSVNTASRMESHGEPGRIQVTARVFDGLASTHRFTPRGQVEIKSKGSMETYFLEARLA
jgi:class 3 adenylate cyclase